MTDDELFEQIFAEHCTIGCHEYREEIRNSVLAALKIGREQEREECYSLSRSMEIKVWESVGHPLLPQPQTPIADAIRGEERTGGMQVGRKCKVI